MFGRFAAAYNTALIVLEHLKRFRILPTYWEPGGDELTPTLKLRRRPVAQKYASEIESLYADNPTAEVLEPTPSVVLA